MAVRRILTLAVLGAISSAHASPRSDPTVGRAVFTGATMPHATSIDLDPAAIGLSPVDEIYLAIAGMIDQLHIDLAQPSARVRDVELAPAAMIAVIYHLAGEAITLGFEAHTTTPEAFPANR